MKDICGMGDINRVCQAYIYVHSCGRVFFFFIKQRMSLEEVFANQSKDEKKR